MKETRTDGERIWTKKIFVQNVVEDMDRAALNWTERYMKEPIGWALGPNEYMSFRFWLGNPEGPLAYSNYHMPRGELKWHGKEVFLKRSPGVDLLLPEDFAGALAIGDEQYGDVSGTEKAN